MSKSAKQHVLSIHPDAFCVRYDAVVFVLRDGNDGHVHRELGRGTSRRLAWESALVNTLAKVLTV